MTKTRGATPAGRRASLIVRMSNAAREAGVVPPRIRLVVAIDRLLVRLLQAAPGSGSSRAATRTSSTSWRALPSNSLASEPSGSSRPASSRGRSSSTTSESVPRPRRTRPSPSTTPSGDNARIESFWSRMQVELLDRRSWQTRVGLANAIVEYLEIFDNRQRRHSALGMLTPIEFETRRQTLTVA